LGQKRGCVAHLKGGKVAYLNSESNRAY